VSIEAKGSRQARLSHTSIQYFPNRRRVAPTATANTASSTFASRAAEVAAHPDACVLGSRKVHRKNRAATSRFGNGRDSVAFADRRSPPVRTPRRAEAASRRRSLDCAAEHRRRSVRIRAQLYFKQRRQGGRIKGASNRNIYLEGNASYSLSNAHRLGEGSTTPIVKFSPLVDHVPSPRTSGLLLTVKGSRDNCA
jgi:hypothetical protein